VPIELPLFPLGTVLFPHMPLALHIFEERYRAMMRDCCDNGTTFGVVGIRDGAEVGGSATPFDVGTLAQQHDVEELPDGRYNLLVVGASRFRIESLSHTKLYLTGQVTYLEDTATRATDASLVASVRAALRAYLTTLHGEGDARAGVEVPDEPELLSYIVAASLQVETARRQTLLEIDDVDARLRACLTVLHREAVLLERMLATHQPRAAVASLN